VRRNGAAVKRRQTVSFLGLDEPRRAAAQPGREIPVLGRGHVVREDDALLVERRAVVDPLVVNDVARPVPHEDEMRARLRREPREEIDAPLREAVLAPAPANGQRDVAHEADCGREDDDCRQETEESAPGDPKRPERPQSLHLDHHEERRRWREVVELLDARHREPR
jgi:hypothetical protein